MSAIFEAKDASYSGKRYRLGTVDYAELLPDNVVPFRTTEAKRGAKRRGVLYERKIFPRLLEYLPKTLVHPWFKYGKSGSRSYLQPDAICDREWDVWLFEIKYTHTLDAFWQMTRYYEPIVAKCFGKPVRKIEIVNSFDPDVKFPMPLTVSLEPEEFFSRKSYDLGTIEVIRWKL
jgi:hypothetical protein